MLLGMGFDEVRIL